MQWLSSNSSRITLLPKLCVKMFLSLSTLCFVLIVRGLIAIRDWPPRNDTTSFPGNPSLLSWIFAFLHWYCRTEVVMRWESEFLSMELKNGIHKQTNTHGSKWRGFIKERKIQSSQHRHWEGVESPPKVGLRTVFIPFLKSHYFLPTNLKVKILNIFMASLDPWIKSPPFLMPSGHFTMDQMYALKMNDYQFLFFPQAHGWRRQWHPTPVLLLGKSHGWRSLVGCSLRGR